MPEPGNYAHILSHDGLEEVRFLCPDRRVVPSIKEQTIIAAILSTWDTAIQKTEQLIAAKEQLYSHELSRLFSEIAVNSTKVRIGEVAHIPRKDSEVPLPDDVYVLVRLYCRGIERNERPKKTPTKKKGTAPFR